MQPRERYLRDGPHRLDDLDLIQLVLGSGGRDRPVRQVAMEVLSRFGTVSALIRAEPRELLDVAGLGPAQAARLHASIVLGGRAQAHLPLRTQPVTTVDAAAQRLAPRLRGLPHEELHALFLDRRCEVLGWRSLTRGSHAHTVVDSRQVFRIAIRLGAVAVILAHNHPTGDPTPSKADRDVTRRVDSGGRVLGIRLLDHLIVAGEQITSLAREGLLEDWEEGHWITGA